MNYIKVFVNLIVIIETVSEAIANAKENIVEILANEDSNITDISLENIETLNLVNSTKELCKIKTGDGCASNN
ncbi:hypothetical protein Xen7305DRAFT_00053990 [Xenococcus sp. PCC 7305]|uniref:hypothetical protein n=1 Tax=Xenococcus sp. PCC 7305 TaxID=102125 RepID=UPI0002ACF054|nr:hypothetical protein [Xenococcus sp. PCC 7305]ELS05649.1 hypothetical protein Xen7305DRAFT_00053990 [Xenococcus sp. PCC 7305]